MAYEELQEPQGLEETMETSQLQPAEQPNDPASIAAQLQDVAQPAVGTYIKPPQRKKSLVDDKVEIVKNLIDAFEGHIEERSEWAENRIQRVAKYRGWRESKDFPWPDASNVHLPVIMTDVQRTQDTLHNAVLSTRPVMNAKASTRALEEKEHTIDMLIDHQIFTENGGELKIGSLIAAFCEEGMFITYNPYIKEKQKISITNVAPFPPPGKSWDQHLMERIAELYPKATILPGKRAPWQWIVRADHPLTGEVQEHKLDVFQDSEDDQVQIVCHKSETIFDGPSFIPVELEDIVVPHRCENLQPQTMANPKGAIRVFKVDYPSKDEILKLIDSKFYDEVSNEELEKIKATRNPKDDPRDPESQKILKDDLVGITHNQRTDPDVEPYTRIMFFGKADLDGDGLDEEVVYWFLKDPQILLRARYLSEVYPTPTLRRPFAMAKYIPVNDQFYAIGLLEIMESGYDIIKKTFDQMIDSGDLTNTPWGFYRPMSGMRPEVMRMGPGDLNPSSSPKDDVYFPTFNNNMLGFGQNVIAMVGQILDQATLVGQLQLGGVPQGKSAALRTTSNMQALMQQGDARPERVLRRFFHGLAEIWAQFHELNQIFLPRDKKFRISTGVTTESDPYIEVKNRADISGRFAFEFSASILNTNRALAMNAFQTMLGILVNPLLLQAGIVTVDNVHTLLSDFIKSIGQDPKKYITKPTNDPFGGGPKISADDALAAILQGQYPYGSPMEPIEEHLARIKEFAADAKSIDMMSEMQVSMLAQYTATRIQEMQQMLQQQQMMMAAQQMQQSIGGQGGGKPGPEGEVNPPNTGVGGNPQTQGREAIDEAMPQGGGNV